MDNYFYLLFRLQKQMKIMNRNLTGKLQELHGIQYEDTHVALSEIRGQLHQLTQRLDWKWIRVPGFAFSFLMIQNADGLWESIMQTILLNLLGSFNSLVYVGIDRMPIKLDYIISVLSLVKVKCVKWRETWSQ